MMHHLLSLLWFWGSLASRKGNEAYSKEEGNVKRGRYKQKSTERSGNDDGKAGEKLDGYPFSSYSTF
jgi:hypothetical protein